MIDSEDYEVEISLSNGEVTDLFQPAYTINSYKKKVSAIEELVSGATEEEVRSFLMEVIADRYLGRNRFISYYEAGDFISELEDIIDEDVRRMIDNGSYLSAFEIMKGGVKPVCGTDSC